MPESICLQCGKKIYFNIPANLNKPTINAVQVFCSYVCEAEYGRKREEELAKLMRIEKKENSESIGKFQKPKKRSNRNEVCQP
jgi:hypothetical protein